MDVEVTPTTSDDSFPSFDNDHIFSFGLTDTGLFLETGLESESSLTLPLVETSNDSTIPIHILFDNTLHIFKRYKSPMSLSKRFLRFFPKLCCSNPKDVISFLQTTVRVCFYKKNSDGSFAGGFPYFFYNENYFNGQFNFASFYDHLFARLTNLELPVAANVKYLYLLTDKLLNVNLKSTLTSNFFKRGIQNIQICGEPLSNAETIMLSNTH